MQELREVLVDIALNHPKIGIGHVQVPKSLDALLSALQQLKDKPYIKWNEYSTLFGSIGIRYIISIPILLNHQRSYTGNHINTPHNWMCCVAQRAQVARFGGSKSPVVG
jgi:hypothetical protein